MPAEHDIDWCVLRERLYAAMSLLIIVGLIWSLV